MEFMLAYHDINHPNSTYFIEKQPNVMNEVRDDHNILANDLQVTLTIKDYNQAQHQDFGVDFIITDLEY
ncbi:hypothetical protein Bca52824_000083 [Brassica carinata]|uniref:Uncharacterized protein n=1 Tax=Brassica carinata TaxID=52824 RepID=A0A8X7WII9_BRACI|nr:hypothetical protein Bca52824_000083 [Brassica carinata]